MTEKHKETDIVVTHKISVDACVAKEIEELNNLNGIFTLSSCCGHGETGYIIVSGSDIQQMIKLGYELTAMKYLDSDAIADDRIVIVAFKPKSKCSCNDDIYDDRK